MRSDCRTLLQTEPASAGSEALAWPIFTDPHSARAYLELHRWPRGPRCPVCDLTERVAPRKGGYYRCGRCKEDFTVRTGTVLERSHVPLQGWLSAVYLLVAMRGQLSSVRLAKEIGVTQKSAWSLLKRLREATGGYHRRGGVDALHRVVGRLLQYRPKPRSKSARKRVRRAKKVRSAGFRG